MANIVERRGFFWWLDDAIGRTNSRGTSVPGYLTISEEGHIKLTLDGSLWYADSSDELLWPDLRDLARKRRITGSLDFHIDGLNHVLLGSLERTDFFFGDEELPRQKYDAEVCLISNSAYPADFSFDSLHRLRIDLVGLEEWLDLHSIVEEIANFGEDDTVAVRVGYKDHKFVFVTDNGTMSVESLTTGPRGFGAFSRDPISELTFKQENVLTYAPASHRGFDSLKADFFRVEELLSLLLGSQVRLDWPTLVQQDDDEFGSWHRTYFYRDSVPEFEPNPYAWWTNFHAVRDTFGQLFFAWETQLAKYGPPYYLYVFELRHPFIYPEHRFVNLCWALESLHKQLHLDDPEPPSAAKRRVRIESILKKLGAPEDAEDRAWFAERTKGYQKDPSLSDRIFDCLGRLPIAINSEELRVFSARCATVRHAISHEGEPPNDEGVDLVSLAEALSYLYHALLLHEIGLNPELLRSV